MKNNTLFTPHKNFTDILAQVQSSEEQSLLDKWSTSISQFTTLKKILHKTIFIKDLERKLSITSIKVQHFYVLRLFSFMLSVLCSVTLIAMSGVQIPSIVSVFFLCSAIGIGWFLPELYVHDRAKFIQYQIISTVPDFLEELHMVTTSAGFESFGQSLKYIAQLFPGEMGKKLKDLVAMQPYVSEEELLEAFLKDCPDPLINELFLTFSLSNRFGGNVSVKIAELVRFAQTNREQRAKDIGNKTSGLLLGPLLVFHFPALLIIFLVPFLFILQKGL